MASGKTLRNMVKLWTNQSPDAAFAAQTVQIDLSGYSMIAVIHGGNSYQNNTAGMTVSMAIVPSTENVEMIDGSNVTLKGRRTFTASTTGVQFAKGTSCEAGREPYDNNYCCVPKAIYGFRL